MSRLAEYTDLLSLQSLALRSALAPKNKPAPFTNALLASHLGDLIRDADTDELALFTLNAAPSTAPNDPPELARTEFAQPDPLKPRSRKSDDPEVYARAALEYIDRFASVRPMPRARDQATVILEQAATLRQSIRSLNESLKQQSVRADPPSIKAQIAIEQDQIQLLQTEIERMKQRRDHAKRNLSSPRKFTRPKSSWAKPAPMPRPPPKSIQMSDEEEEAFWTTPSMPKALRMSANKKDSLLMDEDMNMADMSASFATPMPTKIRQPPLPPPELEPEEPKEPDIEEEEEEAEDEDTIRISPSSSPRPRSPSPDVFEPPPPPERTSATPPPDPPSPRKNKIKITIDVERIVAKISSTMGDTLMPGQEKPKPKDVIAHLQYIASQDLAPGSPASSITSISITSPSAGGPPTAHQILTSFLLLILLQATPNHSLPLAKVKEELSARVESGLGGLAGQNTTRILYGCVAKRLLKIDRGGGEQVVKFDV